MSGTIPHTNWWNLMYDLRCVGVQLYERGASTLRIEVFQERGPFLNDVRMLHIEEIFSRICRVLRSTGFINAVYFIRGRWNSEFSSHDRISPVSIWFENQLYRFYITYDRGFFLDPRDGYTLGRYPL